jgi:hypothetical protein
MTRFRFFAFTLVLAALSQGGCGGKAVDDPSGDGDGDGDTPAAPVDPLSDEGFPAALNDRFGDYCENVEGCDVPLDQATCQEAQGQISRVYDVETRVCRSLILESLDCLNETWNNCAGGPECSGVANELNNQCAQF